MADGFLASILIAAAVALPAQAIAALAQDTSTPGASAIPQSSDRFEYMCRANGRFVRQGDTACIPTPNGRRIAMCAVAINLLNWNVSERACTAE